MSTKNKGKRERGQKETNNNKREKDREKGEEIWETLGSLGGGR